jgi:hypothetical protein
LLRDELDHVDQRFIMRVGKDDAPAPVSDFFDPAREVALAVDAILIGAALVAKDHGSKEDLAQPVGRVDGADLPL